MFGVPSEGKPEDLARPRLVKHLRPFLELADEAGVEIDPLLAHVGLTRAALRAANTRLPYHQLQWLCEQLIAGCGDPEIGLRAAERTVFIQLDMFGHVIRHFLQVSPHVLAVLDLLARFWSRVAGTAQATLTVSDQYVVICIVPFVEPPPELYDGVAGACCRLIETLGGAGLAPLEVRLPRPRPARPERYEQFFAARVMFESDRLELVYAREALTGPAADVEPPLGDPLSAPAGLRSGSSVAQQVHARLLATLAEGVPSLPQLARKLGVSARTLRRRLQDARTGYAELVDEARRQRALALASRAELDVTALAQRTGFADGSAFARAFRRWTGEAPSVFMRRARAGLRRSVAKERQP